MELACAPLSTTHSLDIQLSATTLFLYGVLEPSVYVSLSLPLQHNNCKSNNTIDTQDERNQEDIVSLMRIRASQIQARQSTNVVSGGGGGEDDEVMYGDGGKGKDPVLYV